MAYASWSVVFGEQPSAAKWNILGTNDASFNDGTGIADAAITPAKLLAGTGSSWAWQSWTPTLSGLMADAKWDKSCTYIQIGKTVHFKIKLTANTTTPMNGAGAATFTLPVTSIDYDVLAESAMTMGSGGSSDDSTNVSYFTTADWASTSTGIFRIHGAGGTYLGNDPMTPAAPFTWTTGDQITVIGTYEAA